MNVEMASSGNTSTTRPKTVADLLREIVVDGNREMKDCKMETAIEEEETIMMVTVKEEENEIAAAVGLKLEEAVTGNGGGGGVSEEGRVMMEPLDVLSQPAKQMTDQCETYVARKGTQNGPITASVRSRATESRPEPNPKELPRTSRLRVLIRSTPPSGSVLPPLATSSTVGGFSSQRDSSPVSEKCMDDLSRLHEVENDTVQSRRQRGKGGKFVSSQSLSVVPRKKSSSEWMLLESRPDGGPIDPSVIPSFKGHIAYRLWDDISADRGVLIGYTRPLKVAELLRCNFVDVVQKAIDESGYAHLPSCMMAHLDMPLLSAFIERWQPDTNTFQMPWGDMSILLHDVARILGLKIDGDLCAQSRELKQSPLVDMCSILGKTESEIMLPPKEGSKAPIYKNGGVSVDVVFQMVKNGTNHQKIAGYLALVSGQTVFLDKSGDRIRPHVFSLVSDPSKVSDYALGAGALAFLYRHLGMASRAEVKGVAGCLTLLQVWIYEYFPDLAPFRARKLSPGEPTAKAWVHSAVHNSDGVTLAKYREMLDDLTAASVRWMPETAPHCAHPTTLFTGCLRFMDIVEPYHPDRCFRQFGYSQIVPYPVARPTKCNRPTNGKGYVIEYPDYVDAIWATRGNHRLVLSERSKLCLGEPDVDESYMSWYRRVSHPIIVNPSDRTVIPSSHAGLEVARSLARIVAPMFSLQTNDEIIAYIRRMRRDIETRCTQLLGDSSGSVVGGRGC